MALQDELVAESNGAHFLRADLHIHSFGGGVSYDVKDNCCGWQLNVETKITLEEIYAIGRN